MHCACTTVAPCIKSIVQAYCCVRRVSGPTAAASGTDFPICRILTFGSTPRPEARPSRNSKPFPPIDPSCQFHSHHVGETSTPSLRPDGCSHPGACLAGPLLRRPGCERDRQASRRPLRPRWHLCHRSGTFRISNRTSIGHLEMHQPTN